MAATGARSAAIAAPASVAARQTPFDRVQSLADLGQDEFIRGGLIDIGHIPVEDGAKFVDEAPHIADELAALALRLDRRTRQ